MDKIEANDYFSYIIGHYFESWSIDKLFYFNLSDLIIAFLCIIIAGLLVYQAFLKSQAWGLISLFLASILIISRILDHIFDVSRVIICNSYFSILLSLIKGSTAVVLSLITYLLYKSTFNRRALKKVQTENISLSSIISLSSEAIIYLGLDGKIRQCNPTAEKILGYNAKELIGKEMGILIPPENNLSSYNHIRLQLFSGKSITIEGKAWLHKDGKIIYLNVTTLPVYNEKSKAIGVYAIFCDITEKKDLKDRLIFTLTELKEANKNLFKNRMKALKANKILKARNKELDTFAHVASHDLKAPLRSVINLSEWIYEDLIDIMPERSKRHLELLKKRTLRMENLLDDILLYAKMGKGKQPLEILDVNQLIKEIAEIIDKPKTFIITIPQTLPVFKTHRLPLHQLFYNFISNAIKHHPSPNQGIIIITFEEFSSYYCFHIEDNGSGIPNKYRRKIFDMFTTLKPKDTTEGSGIGLAIVKKIAAQYGSQIMIKSPKNKKGIVFSFTWPKI